MRRAYISAHVDLRDSFRLSRSWAGTDSRLTIIGPSTSAIEASPWLERVGLPIGTTGNRHSRYTAQARTGVVIAWCLHTDEILGLERDFELSGVVVVRAYDNHAAWITAHQAEFLGGEPVPAVSDASPAIKAMVAGISLGTVGNQGLIDPRERSTAVQALTYMRSYGHTLIPNQLTVEAIRNGWPGTSCLELAELAKQLNAGKRLRYEQRLRPMILEEWARS